MGAFAPRNESMRPGPSQDPESSLPRLTAEADGYVRAFADAERMRAARLPVLPHQELALSRAGARLTATDPELAQDLRSTLERAPVLAQGRERRRPADAEGRRRA